MDTTMETDIDLFGFVSPAISLFTGRHIFYWVSLSHWRSCKKISKVAGELQSSSLKLPDTIPNGFSKAMLLFLPAFRKPQKNIICTLPRQIYRSRQQFL
jgi:hypothetical protein